MVTRKQIDAASPQAVLDMVDAWKKSAKEMAGHADSYRQLVTFPGGQPWSGATRDAAVAMAAKDYAAIDRLRDAIDAMGDRAANDIHSSVIPRLNEARAKIADAEANQFRVNDDLSVTDTRKQANGAPDPKRTQDRDNFERDIRAAANKWWESESAVARQLDSDRKALAANFNPVAAGHPPHDPRPHIQDALSKPLPEDPKAFHDLWQQLTPDEKDWLYSQDHNLGNHPGMPWDPDDHLGRDHYNRQHLAELEQHTAATVDRLQERLNALAAQQYMGDHSATTADQLAVLAPQLLAARHDLDGYRAVQSTLNSTDGPKRYLGIIDENGHAAVAIGNPDKASRNAILVPGTGQDMATFNGSDKKSLAMYNAAMQATTTLGPGDVAVTTWMGYDRPMDLTEAAWPDPARAGAGALESFQSGQRASHVGTPSIDTVVGHSYGSTQVGAAASGGHHLDANNVIAVGSPGMLVDHASDLSLDPGARVFAIRAWNDPIDLVTGLTLGPDPKGSDFGATALLADPGPGFGPFGLLPNVEAHSSYWNAGNPALANMGAVIAGVPPPQVIGPNGVEPGR
ncbi:alpha/beta hydrolase [Mycobacterium asiaticum]|uniref:alpha/beta hydrolase n=1 Tax=Mycobacterium asiaticum TaxID=1790 RepID=UPI00068664F7|nr:alpha/beta hydrolase [Mycobacterium asiaticum]ORA11602.1 hypothetical protein BST16_19080 [Mycobacterium asiaticum DSM 44297]